MLRGRVQPCVQPVDAALVAAGLDEVREWDPDQFGAHLSA
jgi:hypothetical protein